MVKLVHSKSTAGW